MVTDIFSVRMMLTILLSSNSELEALNFLQMKKCKKPRIKVQIKSTLNLLQNM